MAAKHSHHVALTAPLAEYVASQVAKGDYASVSEVFRAGLRLLIEHDEQRALARKRQTNRAADRTDRSHERA